MEDVGNVVTFLRNYAENNAVVLPSKTKGVRAGDPRTMLLPSWETKKQIHEKCVAACKEGSQILKLSAFVSVWTSVLPNIMIQRPRSDLCVVCQKNTMKMSQMVNLDDDVKVERVKHMSEHLRLVLVQLERAQYNDVIQSAKEALREAEAGSCSIDTVHLSFDYAQQVFLPNLPDQPGSINFFNTVQSCNIWSCQ